MGPATDQIVADWIAADWGTSRLRVWAMDAQDRVLASASSDRGMGALTADGFEPALSDLIAPWRAPGQRLEVLICGMAGARQGWIEAPYAATPCAPSGTIPVTAPTRDPLVSVRILPGLSQRDPPDVMRGEETQIAGFIARNPGYDGTLCLPGTHAKWVRLTGGRVISFRTAMTGEMFALLSQGSVLRHSLDDGWDATAFASGVAETLADPPALSAALFGIRAASLLSSVGAGVARARLSGLLIGAELAAMRACWRDLPVTVIGDAALATAYCRALADAGCDVRQQDGATLVLSGLIAARRQERDRT